MSDRRYDRHADRLRCERNDSPPPRPTDHWLLQEYAVRPAPAIARANGWNVNTVRSWINRAMP